MSIIDPGMLRSKYVVYTVTSKSKGTSVERRYSDFDSLRRELLKLFPGCVVPPLPKKKLGKAFETAFLQKRKTALQSFLSELVVHPLLKTSEAVLGFLTMSTKDWETKSKSFVKTLPPKDVAQYRTLEGRTRIDVSKAMESYCNKIANTNGSIEESFRSLKRLSKAVGHDFDRLADSVARAGDVYGRLSETYEELECRDHAMLFMFMGDLHKKLGETYKTLKESFSNNFNRFYDFYCRETQALGEQLEARKAALENYSANEKKLYKKKEAFFEQKNIPKWKLNPNLTVTVENLLKNKDLAFAEMLPDESLEVQKLKMCYGYYNNKCVEEYTRLINKNKPVIKDYFETVPSIYIEREMCLQRIWTDLFKKLKGINLNPDEFHFLMNEQ